MAEYFVDKSGSGFWIKFFIELQLTQFYTDSLSTKIPL